MKNKTVKTCCNRGFTLIELLVVVLIIAVLAAVALPQYNKAVEKARFTQVLTRINTIEKAVELLVLQRGVPYADLLGTNLGAEQKLETGFDLENGLTTKWGSYLADRYWAYAAWCNEDDCRYDLWRVTDFNTGDRIAHISGRYENNVWTRTCEWDGNPVAHIICAMAENVWGNLDE